MHAKASKEKPWDIPTGKETHAASRASSEAALRQRLEKVQVPGLPAKLVRGYRKIEYEQPQKPVVPKPSSEKATRTDLQAFSEPLKEVLFRNEVPYNTRQVEASPPMDEVDTALVTGRWAGPLPREFTDNSEQPTPRAEDTDGIPLYLTEDLRQQIDGLRSSMQLRLAPLHPLHLDQYSDGSGGDSISERSEVVPGTPTPGTADIEPTEARHRPPSPGAQQSISEAFRNAAVQHAPTEAADRLKLAGVKQEVLRLQGEAELLNCMLDSAGDLDEPESRSDSEAGCSLAYLNKARKEFWMQIVQPRGKPPNDFHKDLEEAESEREDLLHYLSFLHAMMELQQNRDNHVYTKKVVNSAFGYAPDQDTTKKASMKDDPKKSSGAFYTEWREMLPKPATLEDELVDSWHDAHAAAYSVAFSKRRGGVSPN